MKNEDAGEFLPSVDNVDALIAEASAFEGNSSTESGESTGSDAFTDAARQSAEIAASIVETFIKIKWDFVQIPEEQKKQVVESAIPVFEKYGHDLPAWLADYEPEFRLGVVLAVSAVGVYFQVKAHDKAAEQKEKAEHQGAVKDD